MSADLDLFGHPALDRRASDGLTRADGGSDEWLTPPAIIDALGPFDLDPCSSGDRRPWDTAAVHYSAQDDGLRQPWDGRVWLNPPYSDAARWLARLAEHNHGTALIFARTETGTWFDHVWPHASALLFLRGRLSFHHVDGKRAKANSGAPSVLVAYGPQDAAVLSRQPLPGQYIPLRASGEVSDRILGSDAARAVGLFQPDGPLGYRAKSDPDAPLRATRAEAEEDERAWWEARGQ